MESRTRHYDSARSVEIYFEFCRMRCRITRGSIRDERWVFGPWRRKEFKYYKSQGTGGLGVFWCTFDTYMQFRKVARWSKLREIEEIDIQRIYRILSTPDLESYSYPIEAGLACIDIIIYFCRIIFAFAFYLIFWPTTALFKYQYLQISLFGGHIRKCGVPIPAHILNPFIRLWQF